MIDKYLRQKQTKWWLSLLFTIGICPLVALGVYHPPLGRFLQRDRLSVHSSESKDLAMLANARRLSRGDSPLYVEAQSENAYQYVGSTPLNSTDPNGESLIIVCSGPLPVCSGALYCSGQAIGVCSAAVIACSGQGFGACSGLIQIAPGGTACSGQLAGACSGQTGAGGMAICSGQYVGACSGQGGVVGTGLCSGQAVGVCSGQAGVASNGNCSGMIVGWFCSAQVGASGASICTGQVAGICSGQASGPGVTWCTGTVAGICSVQKGVGPGDTRCSGATLYECKCGPKEEVRTSAPPPPPAKPVPIAQRSAFTTDESC